MGGAKGTNPELLVRKVHAGVGCRVSWCIGIGTYRSTDSSCPSSHPTVGVWRSARITGIFYAGEELTH